TKLLWPRQRDLLLDGRLRDMARSMRAIALNAHLDAIDARAPRDVERLAVLIAPSHIADHFRNLDCPDMLALRRNNPDSAWPRAVNVSILVQAHPVRYAFCRIGRGIKKHHAVRHRSVRLHPVTQ